MNSLLDLRLVSLQKHLGEKEGTALLKRMRYSYDEVGEVIEYSEGYYNTEMQHYVVNYDI